ncbi:head completion/stabilization protein [uncultured Amphritea sp.]|uniref:head completion/stabilization protein n=1 Tax=uncultured Amphritea sp. TaxID=981605 RepID=UPI0025E2DBF6|nr:head completion/stabilization protein [uncultured Amphritea sp.]
MSFSGITRQDVQATTLANAAFFPDVELKEFVDTYRIPSDYHTSMVTEQLYLAMSDINLQLNNWRKDQIALGVTALEDAEAEAIGNVSPLVRLYKQAVFCLAKAKLLTDFATVFRKAEAENLGKEAPEREEKLMEQSNQAVRGIIGKPRITSELI